jgi:hypothetical protein
VNDSDRKFFSCEKKRCYPTWRDAEHVAMRARRKGRNAGVILVPFNCKSCSCYHLASADSVQRQARRDGKRRRHDDDE